MICLTNTIQPSITFSMNELDIRDRARILSMLVEGNSMRVTSRFADVSINTVTKLLMDVGIASAEHQDKTLRNLPCKRLQCDEIWSFCYSKEKYVPENKRGQFGVGDVWTWTAIDADTKLVPAWVIGPRDGGVAYEFMQDLAGRLSSRVQLTTDGLKAYLEAVEAAFSYEIDYAQLVKLYGSAPNKGPERKYSPDQFCGTRASVVAGAPEAEKISTSFVERQNLTMRLSMHRFTRLTNGFSKKIENLGHAVALHIMYYNFGRIHKMLRVTPAMAAGVTDHVWSLEEIAAMADSN